MDNDDRTIGQILSRRQVVALLGVSGYAMLARRPHVRALAQGVGQAPPACVVRPQQTEGPYFVDTQLHRADIRSDPSDGTIKAGVPLALGIVVSRLSEQACTPLPGVMVDIWQCDADGVYSGVQDPRFSTLNQKFLRGYQLTGADGAARFTTIYPGWYQGRTVHIHFKLRSPATHRPGYEFTSQLYFQESVTDAVFAKAPYAARGRRSTLNANDGIFRRGGAELMLATSMQDVGYAATFHVALEGV